MAVDQALLDLVARPVLRIYQWDAPTLSLGYFQAVRDCEQHAESRGCPVLRRSTGGGAILHDSELTYSLAFPATLNKAKSSEWYNLVHETVADLLATHRLVAKLHPARPADATATATHDRQVDCHRPGGSPRREPFLCFQRRAEGDLILWPTREHGPSADQINGHKVLGSAQRKRDGAILQHGSILFCQSRFAPQLLGINDFLVPERRCDRMEFGREFVDRLLYRFGWTGESAELTAQERALAVEFERERFSHPKWTSMR
jgi:lipoyl(octanoyl) transferase